MVRLTLNANLTGAELDHVERAARMVAPRVRPWDWPIVRRRASTQQTPMAIDQP
jgi:CAI-1 autoinducer synthase